MISEMLAKAILRAALNEGRSVELLECLFNGGSATIDATSGDLVLADADIIQQLVRGPEEWIEKED